jgi:FAD/FMN-containing dehydrogenase/Fe-S oxidoreductase
MRFTELGTSVSEKEIIRGLYATDASHYQIMPAAVVWPKDEEDVLKTLTLCRRNGMSVTARGAATSLSGQTHGSGMVMDLSRHMNRILEINPAEGWARVQPGAVRDHLNAEAAPHGLHFAPDPSTSSRATVGGMIGNNSAGTRSILYGKTSDHVLACRVALMDGRVLDFGPAPRRAWAGDPAEPLYEGLRALIDRHREEIHARYPKVMRRVGGYALDAFLDDPEQTPWNLSNLICGSEGTLGILLEVTVRLTPLPAATALVAVHFEDIPSSLRAVEGMLAYGPSAVELLDGVVLREARVNSSTRELSGFIEGTPGAMQLVEFFGDTAEEAADRARRFAADLQASGTGYAWPVFEDAKGQQRVWEVRRLGLGLISNKFGSTKGQAFIDDACIPLPVLPEYIDKVTSFCRGEGVDLVLYAHSSVGVLHVTPELDLHKPEDIARMRRIAEYAFELCMEYGGSHSGEHGDGLVRGEFIRRFYGETLYGAFREVKALFDPGNLMNPGKIIDPAPMTEHMRYQAPGYAEKVAAAEAGALFHHRAQGGLGLAVEQCNGVGACRKIGSGVMCPSYMATRDEKDSTRARANALRLAMSGQLGGGNPDEAMASDELHEVMELCLGCKACKQECPNAVDVAKMKSETLQKRHDLRGTPLGVRLVGGLPAMAHLFCGPHAGLVNALMNLPLHRRLLAKLTGIDPRRPLPRFARRSLQRCLGGGTVRGEARRGEVALYIDSYTNAYDPQVGEAALQLLADCGYRVHALFPGDSQRARISKGLLRDAKRKGEKLLRALDRQAPGDRVILCLEPSCASALKDDLPDLVDDPELGRRISPRVFMVDEFLHREGVPLRPRYERLLVHGHCHQKALFSTEGLRAPDLGAGWIDAGCCGMAGSFGYEHRDLSLTIGEDRLFPAIRAAEPGTTVVANGFSCRHQIQDALGIYPKHYVEVVSPA